MLNLGSSILQERIWYWLHAAQFIKNGDAPRSVGFFMWMPKPQDAESNCTFSGFFQARKSWPTRCLGMIIFLWEPECWIKSVQLLWEPARKNFTLPSNPCIPGLGFYQTTFVNLLDFSNKQWNANSWPEGKPSSYWRGKEHNIQMTHGSVGEVMAACHSLGCGFVVRCHMEWMYSGCDVNLNGCGRNSPVISQRRVAC